MKTTGTFFKGFFVAWIIYAVLCLAFAVACVGVAWHFIAKFW